MDISIIICTRNRAGSLKQTLASAARLHLIPGLEHELIVVNNGSTDDTALVLSKFSAPGLKFLPVDEPRKGLSRARNRGVREAGGKILLFTDDDVELPENWMATMCRPIWNGMADAVVGEVTLAEEMRRPWMKPIHRSWLAGTETVNFAAPDVLVGANMGVSRDVFEKVTGFDEELGAGALGSGEETLFALQMKEAGFRIAGATGSGICHHPGKERLLRKSWLAAAESMGKSAAYLNYHWRHENISFGRAGYRLCRNLAWYSLFRILKWRECGVEGIPEWEMFMLERHHRLSRHLVEMKRSRNYGLRGLARRNPHDSAPGAAKPFAKVRAGDAGSIKQPGIAERLKP